jgi:hypothetical protein
LASLRVDVQPDGPRSPSQVTGDRYA